MSEYDFITVQRNKTGSVVVNRSHWNHVNHYRVGRNFVESQRRRLLRKPIQKHTWYTGEINEGYLIGIDPYEN